MRTVLLILVMGCSEYNLSSPEENQPHTQSEEDTGTFGQDHTDTSENDGAITGRVCEPSGNGWVIGARVWIEPEDGTTVEAYTDVDGRFLLENVPPGAWTLHIEKGSFQSSVTVTVKDTLVTLAQDECLSSDVRIAVLQGDYDTTQELLSDLALPFDLIAQGGSHQIDFLNDPARLQSYDIIFLNCGMDEDWLYEAKENVASNIQDYVSSGRSLYASDWTFQLIEAAFPTAVDFYGSDDFPSEAYSGDDGHLKGSVHDPNMQGVLGSDTAQLHYDLAGWVIATGADATTEVLVSGHPATIWQEEPLVDAPLAVRFQAGSGTVVFTTFHNEPQITLDMNAMLREIILSL
jgi:hypothetical protein